MMQGGTNWEYLGLTLVPFPHIGPIIATGSGNVGCNY